jgi:hypothetical protein
MQMMKRGYNDERNSCVCVRVSVDVRKLCEAGNIWSVLMGSVKLDFSTVGVRYQRLAMLSGEQMREGWAASETIFGSALALANLLPHPEERKLGQLTKLPLPPTTNLCLPSQLFGASLFLCITTVLLCSLVVISYQALNINLFSRRRFSSSW